MATFPVATGARLLGIHPKTLHHWLKAAAFPLTAHPTDARLKCVAEEHLLELAKQHGRPLPTLSSVPALDSYVASSLAEVQVKPLPAHEVALAHRAALLSAPTASLADLLQQLAQLHTQVATLQHQLTGLALELLPERNGCSEHRLRPLEALVLQTLEPVHAPSQTTLADLPVPSHPPERRLLPAEVRARSRVTALIEYGAQGQYVAVCPRQGVLALVPDSSQWFDWLASLTSFRFVGPAGRFSACRASEKGQYTRCWAARRFFHGHDFWHYLGVTDRLTLASLEQAAAALQARVDAL
jgi:DNA-binding transcriptional MerR regulator